MAEPTPEQWQAIEQALYEGRKIQAIKLLREATGSDLIEAKRIADEHEARLREEFPDRFQQRQKAGCGASVIVFLLMLGLAMLV